MPVGRQGPRPSPTHRAQRLAGAGAAAQEVGDERGGGRRRAGRAGQRGLEAHSQQREVGLVRQLGVAAGAERKNGAAELTEGARMRSCSKARRCIPGPPHSCTATVALLPCSH